MSQFIRFGIYHSKKSSTIRELKHGLGVCKEHYAEYYVPKSSILLVGTGIWKISSVACGFSSVKSDYSDYPKSLISGKKTFMFFSIKNRYSNILFNPPPKYSIEAVCFAAITLVKVLTWFL